MAIKSWLLAAALAATPFVSQAAVVTPGFWQTFDFDGVDSDWSDTFSVTLTSGAWLKVTDAYMAGDQFEVFANGYSLGLTSIPTGYGDQIGGDYDAAFADSRWSSGSFYLGAGTWTISGITRVSPFGSGSAALQVAPVPEPETYALMGLGLLGLAAARRRSQK
ncbi:FxDxF family PEP-CTERM protein [Chitinibacteraceae bacterium HSL-7]